VKGKSLVEKEQGGGKMCLATYFGDTCQKREKPSPWQGKLYEARKAPKKCTREGAGGKRRLGREKKESGGRQSLKGSSYYVRGRSETKETSSSLSIEKKEEHTGT